MPLSESCTLEVLSHNSVQIAATGMNPIWMCKPGFVYSFVWRDVVLWFETLYVDSMIVMTEAVKLEYFEGAIIETIKPVCSKLQ